ncbi:MAG TPA: tetratricopeptide repeat protein, partial [Acidimicrobiia bacterium]|nr:tetratricopeptide repeat protein [Acidimicrobiia bacterium]
IRTALRWSLEHGEARLALEIAANAWIFWNHQGLVGEGREWLAAALRSAGEAEPELVVRALIGAGELAVTQDDRTTAEKYLSRARDIAEASDDFVTAAAALRTMVSLPYRAGDLTTAARGFEEALALARRGGNPSQVSTILAGLALIDEDQGRLEEAESHAAEALSLRKQTQDQYGVADALLTWAEISINRGRLDEAGRALREALDISTRNGFQDIGAWQAAYRGKLEMCWGNTDEGVRLLEDALHRFQERGQPNGAAWALRHLGKARLEQGDLTRAEVALVDALDLAVSHVIPDAPRILEALGQVAVAAGDTAHAAFVLAAARHLREEMGLAIAVAEQPESRAAWSAVERQLGADHAATISTEAAGVPLGDLPGVLARRSAMRRFAPPAD